MAQGIEERLANMEADINSIHKMVSQLLKLQKAQSKTEETTYLSANEVADMLKTDVNKVYAGCKNGQLPHERMGKKYRFKRDDVMAWWASLGEESDYSVEKMVASYLHENPRRG